jgi:hypothetical protein
MAELLLQGAIEETKRKKLGAQWMIVGEGGVTQSGGLDARGRSLGVLTAWEGWRTELPALRHPAGR